MLKEEKVSKDKLLADCSKLLLELEKQKEEENQNDSELPDRLFLRSYLIKILQESFDSNRPVSWEETLKKLVLEKPKPFENVTDGYNFDTIRGTNSRELPKYLAMEQIMRNELPKYIFYKYSQL